MTDFDYQKTGSMDEEISDTHMGRHATTRFAKSVVALMMVIPVLVIFSPVLAAAIVAAFPLGAVYLASGVVSITVAKVMECLSKNTTQPSQSDERKAGRPLFDMVSDERYITGYESLDKMLSFLIHVVKESFVNSVGGVYGKVVRWMYKYVKGEHPTGADTLDRATRKLGSKVRELSDQEDNHELVKAAAGGSLVFLSALTFTGTVITLAMAAPGFVIFSPVLVPALITMFLLACGFLSSAVFGVAGVSVLTWMYKYVSGGHPVGAELLDQVAQKFGYMAGANSLDIEISGASEHAIRGGHADGQKFTRSVVALLVAAPLLLILSPLLVPMMIAILMLGSLCLAAGAFSAAATRMFEWAYSSVVTGGRQSRAHSMDNRTLKLGLSDLEMRERGERKMEEGRHTAAVGGGHNA